MLSRVYSKKRSSLHTNRDDPNMAGAVRLRQWPSEPPCPHLASKTFLIYLSCFTLDSRFTRPVVGTLMNPP